jgi:Na+/proline symporter
VWVRGFRAIYLGLFFNVVIMAAVNLAAAKIANVLLGWPMEQTLVVCGLINVAMAATSGLWGVLVTDFVQFGIAMTGSITAAVYALRRPEVGGLDGLVEKLGPQTLAMVPSFDDWSVALGLFIIPLTVQWWATWYPGAEPGGGSYIAQRMLAAKSERDAFAGTLLFNVAHYAVRPWPWLIVALSSMLVFPEIADIARALPHVDSRLLGHDMAYPAMLTFLPAGLLGLIVAGLLAAYVSTISTHLNWGTSYLVHDCYRRFLRPGQSERHYVQAGRVVTGVLMILAGFMTLVLDTAQSTFNLLLSIGAGTGLLYLLRWYWWRINAWSEIAAMVSSFVIAVIVFVGARYGVALPTHLSLVATVLATTVVWLATTYLTAATDPQTLRRFYALARPAGPGWRSVRGLTAAGPAGALDLAFLGWIAGCAFVYSALFGMGHFLLGHTMTAVLSGLVFVVSGAVLSSIVPKLWAAK